MINKILKTTLGGVCASIMMFAAAPVQGYDAYSAQCYDPCGCSDQFWVDAEYLYWGIKNSPEPVVLVSEGASDTAEALTPVIGGANVSNDWRSGGKFGLGYWFDETRHYGIEGNYFFIPTGSTKKTVSSDALEGSNYLVAPYYDVVAGAEAYDYLIANPGVWSGTATRKIGNWMQGAELNGLAVFPCDCNFNVTALVGFRYWNFNENLTFSTNSPYVAPHAIDIFETTDKFDVQNNFYGGQVGVGFDYSYDCFSVNVKAKVALGAIMEELDIHGSTLTNDFDSLGVAQEFEGGVYALPTNIGHHNKTNFSVIPEVEINFGYQVTDCFRLKLGYTFFYVSNMIWAGDQIDANINQSQSVAYTGDASPVLVGQASPTAFLRTSSFWAQGVNAGFEFQF
ncbi:MAG: BBP7 family outer membrane beta-barrel protein [Parachlamydiaceae bacterium]